MPSLHSGRHAIRSMAGMILRIERTGSLLEKVLALRRLRYNGWRILPATRTVRRSAAPSAERPWPGFHAWDEE
jgi:hypothetical protein